MRLRCRGKKLQLLMTMLTQNMTMLTGGECREQCGEQPCSGDGHLTEVDGQLRPTSTGTLG